MGVPEADCVAGVGLESAVGTLLRLHALRSMEGIMSASTGSNSLDALFFAGMCMRENPALRIV